VVNLLKIVKNTSAGVMNRYRWRNEDGLVERFFELPTRSVGYLGDAWVFRTGWSRAEEREVLGSRHGAVMHLELAERLVRTYSDVGALVLDPMAGTGTTGVACLRWGRRFLLFEPWGEAVRHARRRLANALLKL
jgi:DNA modification methylase